MKANELMIGDWVLYGKKPVKVLQLSEGEDYENISPIPLTSEILKKSGFQYYHKNFAFLPEKSEFALRHDKYADENGISLWTYDCIEIRYVHELQHAFKLCGIKLEIKL